VAELEVAAEDQSPGDRIEVGFATPPIKKAIGACKLSYTTPWPRSIELLFLLTTDQWADKIFIIGVSSHIVS